MLLERLKEIMKNLGTGGVSAENPQEHFPNASVEGQRHTISLFLMT
jgi:hypothetical protein